MFHDAIKLLLEVLMQLKGLNNSYYCFSVEADHIFRYLKWHFNFKNEKSYLSLSHLYIFHSLAEDEGCD